MNPRGVMISGFGLPALAQPLQVTPILTLRDSVSNTFMFGCCEGLLGIEQPYRTISERTPGKSIPKSGIDQARWTLRISAFRNEYGPRYPQCYPQIVPS